MSKLPPTLRGGTIECSPGSAIALPIVPAKGFNGTRPCLPNRAGSNVLGSYFHSVSAASVNWSASRPKPGMFAVQPKPEGLKLSMVIFNASPGSAPSTKIGPFTGLILPKSSVLTSFTVLSAVSCPAELSIQ